MVSQFSGRNAKKCVTNVNITFFIQINKLYLCKQYRVNYLYPLKNMIHIIYSDFSSALFRKPSICFKLDRGRDKFWSIFIRMMY